MPQNTVMYMRSALTKRRRCRRHCRLNATTHDRRRNGTKQNPPATTTLQGKENDRNVKTHTHTTFVRKQTTGTREENALLLKFRQYYNLHTA